MKYNVVFICQNIIAFVTLTSFLSLCQRNDVVDEVPVFVTRMHPRSCVSVGQSENCVCEKEIVDSASSQQQDPITVAFSHSLLPLVLLAKYQGLT